MPDCPLLAGTAAARTWPALPSVPSALGKPVFWSPVQALLPLTVRPGALLGSLS